MGVKMVPLERASIGHDENGPNFSTGPQLGPNGCTEVPINIR